MVPRRESNLRPGKPPRHSHQRSTGVYLLILSLPIWSAKVWRTLTMSQYAALREQFDFSRYPLGRHQIKLRMWHPDHERNVYLTPNFGGVYLE